MRATLARASSDSATGADRAMQVHAAFVAQRHEARMHLRRNRTRMRAARAILRPQLLLPEIVSARYSMMASESQIVTSPSIRAGTLPAREKLRMRCLSAGSSGIERNEDLIEGDVVGAQRQPRPHRPRRIVLVADHEFQSHVGDNPFCDCSSCHSAREAFNLRIVPVARLGMRGQHATAGMIT